MVDDLELALQEMEKRATKGPHCPTCGGKAIACKKSPYSARATSRRDYKSADNVDLPRLIAGFRVLVSELQSMCAARPGKLCGHCYACQALSLARSKICGGGG